MKAMGADSLGLSDAELKQIVTDWREASPHITELWWAVDKAVKKAIKEKTATETHGLKFSYESGFLFIELPSGRRLAYAKPRIGENQFGGESVTYMGINAQKKWDRLETFGGKLTENICQSIARDLLMYSPCRNSLTVLLSLMYTMKSSWEHRKMFPLKRSVIKWQKRQNGQKV